MTNRVFRYRMASVNPTSMNNARRFLTSNARQYLVINVVGLDRPGIVAEMTNVLSQHDGNIGESRAIRLGDHFSMMVLADVPKNQNVLVKKSLSSLDGLFITSFDTCNPNKVDIKPTVAYKGQLELNGADHPGIVHKISSLLAKHQLNINILTTSDEDAPFGGTKLFIMKCSVTALKPIPQNFDPDVVREELKELGDSLNCDIDLEHDN